MGRVKVAVAGVATLVVSVVGFGDDVGRFISHSPHKPPSIHGPRLPGGHQPLPPIDPPPVKVPPVELPPVEPPRVEVPPVVWEWTEGLTKERAESVAKAACTLRTVQQFADAQSDSERWDIAVQYVSEQLYEESDLDKVVGLGQRMLGGENLNAVEEFCNWIG